MTLGRIVVAWIPPLMVLWFGVLYLFDCLEVVAAPGAGFDLAYMSRTGPIRLTSKSYSIDPLTHRLDIGDLIVRDATGGEVATFRRLRLKLVPGSVDAVAYGFKGEVVRRRDGSLSVVDLLPVPDPKAPPQSFKLTLDRGEIEVRDLTGVRPATDDLLVTQLTVESDGDWTVISGGVSVNRQASAMVKARIDLVNRCSFSITNLNADLRGLRPTIERWVDPGLVREASGWNFDALNVSGDLDLRGNAKGVEDLDGNLAIVGQEVRKPGLLEPSALVAKVRLFTKAAEIEARLTSGRDLVTWQGPVSWASGFAGSGQVIAEAGDSRNVWPIAEALIPRNVNFRRAKFEGVVGFARNELGVVGSVEAESFAAAGETIRGAKGQIVASQDSVRFELKQGTWRDAGVKGWVASELRSGKLAGVVETAGSGLVPVQFPIEGGKITARAQGRAIIQGTPAHPEVVADLVGFASGTLDGRVLDFGEIDARVGWKSGRAEILRAVASGSLGIAQATGTINTDSQSLNLGIELAGVDLGAFQNKVTGVAYGSGRITGTMKNPKIQVRTTALNVTAEKLNISRAVGDLVYENGEVLAQNLEVGLGTGVLAGQIKFVVESGEIKGLLTTQELFVSDLVEDAAVVGKLTAEKIEVTGTIENPQAAFVIGADELLVSGVTVRGVSASGIADLEGVKLDSARALVGDGSIEASGRWSTDGKSGRVILNAVDLPLSSLPIDRETVDVSGRANLNGEFRLSPQGSWSGSGDVQLTGVLVNDFEAGGGRFKIDVEANQAKIFGGISSIGGLLELPEMTYDLSKRHATGTLLVTNLELQGVIRAISKELKFANIEAQRAFRGLSGQASAELAFYIEIDNNVWSADVKSFGADDLQTQGRVLGNVDLIGRLTPKQALIDQFKWVAKAGTPEESRVEIAGQWVKGDEQVPDEIDASGRLVGFDPYLLSVFWPEAAEFHARADSDFLVKGPVDDLKGYASLSVGKIQIRADSGDLIDVPIDANLDTIDLREGNVDVSGRLRFQGFEGLLSAKAPISAFEESPKGLLDASLILRDRSLSSLTDYLPGLDQERSRGVVGGRIKATGDRRGLKFEGLVELKPEEEQLPQLAMKDVAQVFMNVGLQIQLAGESAGVNFKADGGMGGSVAANLKVDLKQFLAGNYDLESLSQAPLTEGAITLNQLKLSERIRLANPLAGPGKPKFIEALKPTTGELNGKLTISGQVGEPVISGDLEAGKLNVTLPAEFPEGQVTDEPTFNPIFRNLRLVAKPGSVLNIPTGNLRLSGSTVINGTFTELDIRAPFTVESGTLNLPSSRVALEEGTVMVTAGFGGDPRAEINLQGSTVVTVRRSSDQYQTYRLNLDVRGNLLDPEGVRISGTSDPPDLSPEEIRAIVGQRDFIEGLLDTALGTGRRSGLTDSIFTLAVPSLTQKLTGDLATALDLDYLVLDYNPFDGAIIRAGREISRGLMGEVSRQVTAQSDETQKFELRLSYRPPSKNPFFSRVRITFGATERLPYKVGVSYSTKF